MMNHKLLSIATISTVISSAFLLTACINDEKANKESQVVEQTEENNVAETHEYQIGEIEIEVPNNLYWYDEGESGVDAHINFRVNDQDEGNEFSIWTDYNAAADKTLKEYVDAERSMYDITEIVSEETYEVNGIEVNETEFIYTIGDGEGVIKENRKIFFHNGNAYKFWYGASINEFNEEELAIVDEVFKAALTK